MNQDDFAEQLFFIGFSVVAGVMAMACMLYALIGIGMIL